MNPLNALAFASSEVLAVSATNTSTLTGTGVDVSAYEGVAVAVLNTAKGTGTTPTLNGKLQSSDAVGGTYADISGATFAEVTASADVVEAISFVVSDAKAFVRFIGTIAGGGSESFVFGVELIGIHKAS